MANVVIGKIEVALADVAKWLSGVKEVALKGPAIITAIASLLSEIETVVLDAESIAANPVTVLSVSVQTSTIAALKTVWTDIKAVFTAAGVTI